MLLTYCRLRGNGLVRVLTTVAGLQRYLELKRRQPRSPEAGIPTIGLVPTMGALHAGHLSLIAQARQQNPIVVVSIFVNPLQFGPAEDFGRYPRTLETDQQLCEQAGVDVIFAPSAADLGIGEHKTGLPFTQVVPPQPMLAVLCGRTRIGHFQGVATIVTKLLNLVRPDRAYFGRKDAQQLAIIQRLVMDLNLPVEIIPCPTYRESNGLAMSSRNRYLSEAERDQAAAIYRALQQAEQAFQAGERRCHPLVATVKTELAAMPAIALEYVELVDPTTMQPLETVEESGLLAVAARLGAARLIDNVILSHRQPIVAIDGPAGAGKSTVARLLAQELGLLYLDTGAMYRAVTWLTLESGVAVDDEPSVAELVSRCEIEVSSREAGVQVCVNGRDVTQAIRNLDVTANVSAIAAHPAVREALVKQQQRYGRRGGIVMEGRDIGTHVFPDAELKIFLTASVQERARRRQWDLQNQGKGDIALVELEKAIAERDHKDSTRAIAPLQKAPDAIEINTDGYTIPDVIQQITQIYNTLTR